MARTRDSAGPPGPEHPPPKPPGGARKSWTLIRTNRDFRRFYTAQLISFAGDWFLLVALYGLVLDSTGSALLASLILVAELAPQFFVAPIGGALADRMNRQVLMVVCDLAHVVLCLGFLLAGPDSIWVIYPLLVGMAVFSAVFEPTSNAAVPNLVDPEDLATANVLVGSAWGVMLAVGAAAGGFFTAVAGRHAAYVADALTFLVSAVLLASIRRPFSEAREDEEHVGILEATKETVRYARSDGRVTALLAVKGGFGLAGGVLVLLPVFATDVFHKGDTGIGILYGLRGVGALIGPFLGRRIAGNSERGLFTAIGAALACFGLFYLVFPFMPSLLLAGVCSLGAHLGGGAQWTLSTYGLQQIVPDRIRGRVFAFDFALVTLTIMASNLVSGLAVEAIGPRRAMLAFATVGCLFAAGWWLGTRRVRRRLA
jgi:predicted MFS family arabinose efflux permease